MDADVTQFNKDKVAMVTCPKTSQLSHSVIERAKLLLCMNIEPGQVRAASSQSAEGALQSASFLGHHKEWLTTCVLFFCVCAVCDQVV